LGNDWGLSAIPALWPAAIWQQPSGFLIRAAPSLWRRAGKSAVMAWDRGGVRYMSRVKANRTCLIASAALGALALGEPARAADLKLPVKAPYLQAAFDWTGFYIGGHTGYSRGSNSATLWDPLPTATSGNFSGVIGGVQAGYNWRASSGLLFGVEADLTFPNYLHSNSQMSLISTPRTDFIEDWDYIGTVRGRIGYASSHWLLYATGGFAYMGERFTNMPANALPAKHIDVRAGWAAGAGVEYAFAPHWTVRLEYLYSQFERANVAFPSGERHTSTNDLHMLRLGLNRKIDLPGSPGWKPNIDITDPESTRWEIHGQTTYLPQGYPAFHAPYSGTNSLTPAPQAQATWSNSLFLNMRLWDGCRDSASTTPSASAASPVAKRRSRTSPIRITTLRACSFARPSASAAGRRSCRAGSFSSPTRSTSTG
jgi:high affinity Mn2+ porin